MSISSPSADIAIAEHSICQPGRPSPHGDSQAASSPGFCAFHRAKSRGACFFEVISSGCISSIFWPESAPYDGNSATRKYTSPSDS